MYVSSLHEILFFVHIFFQEEDEKLYIVLIRKTDFT